MACGTLPKLSLFCLLSRPLVYTGLPARPGFCFSLCACPATWLQRELSVGQNYAMSVSFTLLPAMLYTVVCVECVPC